MATAYVEIPLGGRVAAGRVTLVDVDDYELVSQHNWFAKEDPSSGLYAATNVADHSSGFYRQKTLRMHRLISDYKVTDHADGDGLNNRRYKLREGAGGRNAKNRRRNTQGSSRHRGVCWYPNRQKWCAYIMSDKRRKTIGYFADEDDAGRAYDEWAKALHGEYARLNFPGV